MRIEIDPESGHKFQVFDWGDGHEVRIRIPNLDILKAVVCNTPCYPEGEEGTGQVEKPKPPETNK